MKAPTKCSNGLCTNPAKAKGMCHRCYQRQRRTGSMKAPPAPRHLDVNVTFRCPPSLKERMVALAAQLGGADVSELWRDAGEQFCKSHPRKTERK